MKETLLEKLIGTWSLVELIEVPVDGGEINYPMGEKPKGLIIYNHDGYMSAQIMNPERNNFNQEHWTGATQEECKQEVPTYLAYSGAFSTDDGKQTLYHSMYVSLFPNWTGQTQSRRVHFKDELLHLESGEPFLKNGKMVTHKLTWVRVKQSGNAA